MEPQFTAPGEVLADSDARQGFGPVPPQQRIAALDVLRGFALLGIFSVNIQHFAMPVAAAYGGPELLALPWTEQLAWAAIRVFCESKFITLFSLLFGIGLVINSSRAEVSGRRFTPLYLRRLAWLAVIGLAHGLLVWDGDILFLYAVLGVPLLLFRGLSGKWLLVIGAGTLCFSVLLSTGWEALAAWVQPYEDHWGEVVAADPLPPADDPEARRINWWEAMNKADFDLFHPAWQRGESQAYRAGPFAEAFAFRAVSFALSLVAAILDYGWRVGAFFISGMSLMKLGFFQPHCGDWHKRLAVVGLGLGLPLEVLSVELVWQGHGGGAWISPLAAALHAVGSVSLCFGYLGLITLVVSSGGMRPITSLLAYAGRMPLSNYLLQSVVATGIMYWWGLGLFGQFGRPVQLGLVIVVFSSQVLLSAAWLRMFRFGPMEWLWRSLTYAEWQPLWREKRHDGDCRGC